MIQRHFHYEQLTVSSEYQYRVRRNAHYNHHLQGNTDHPSAEAERLYIQYRRCLSHVNRISSGLETFWIANCSPGDESVPRCPEGLSLPALYTLRGIYRRAIPFCIRYVGY